MLWPLQDMTGDSESLRGLGCLFLNINVREFWKVGQWFVGTTEASCVRITESSVVRLNVEGPPLYSRGFLAMERVVPVLV